MVLDTVMALEFVRTPDAAFRDLPDFPFKPCYVDVPDGVGGTIDAKLRVHYLDEGPRDAKEVIVCMHGQPSWCFLYRLVVPHLVKQGYRVLCPDLIGFGRSDKPVDRAVYTYARHVGWMSAWLDQVEPSLATGARLTLFAQDWGGLVGLRVLTARPERFSRIVLANTGLPDGVLPGWLTAPLRASFEQMPAPQTMDDVRVGFRAFAALRRNKCRALGALCSIALLRRPPRGDADEPTMPFLYWVKHAAESPSFSPSAVVCGTRGDGSTVPPEIWKGYAAPFPSGDERFLAGARQFPSLVPLFADGGAVACERDVSDNKAAWEVLRAWRKPLLTCFSDKDPITRGAQARFQREVPGARGRAHPTIRGAGHFLQEEAPEELANIIGSFVAETASEVAEHQGVQRSML